MLDLWLNNDKSRLTKCLIMLYQSEDTPEFSCSLPLLRFFMQESDVSGHAEEWCQ